MLVPAVRTVRLCVEQAVVLLEPHWKPPALNTEYQHKVDIGLTVTSYVRRQVQQAMIGAPHQRGCAKLCPQSQLLILFRLHAPTGKVHDGVDRCAR